jgi:hypothetical protein
MNNFPHGKGKKTILDILSNTKYKKYKSVQMTPRGKPKNAEKEEMGRKKEEEKYTNTSYS